MLRPEARKVADPSSGTGLLEAEGPWDGVTTLVPVLGSIAGCASPGVGDAPWVRVAPDCVPAGLAGWLVLAPLVAVVAGLVDLPGVGEVEVAVPPRPLTT